MERNLVLSKAIGIHSKWSFKLKQAIKSSTSEFKPEIVRTDNNCELGLWLYNDAPKDFKLSPAYQEIMDLHTRFHKEAARILSLALSGKKDEALEEMGLHSEYAKLSSALVEKFANLKIK